MSTIIKISNSINWNDARIHRNSIISPISKVLMLYERINNEASYRSLAIAYNVSHTTCWRLIHDTQRLYCMLFEDALFNNS